MFVYLRKRSHNRLSPRLCTKEILAAAVWFSRSNPVVLKVWVDTPTSVAKGQTWVAPRRSKPKLCIFNITTACLCLSLV